MYSGENVVILNYSEWIIQLGLYICYFLLLVLCTKLYIHSPSKAPIYLSYQTKKNWESQYLTDLKFANNNGKCDDDNYKEIELGKWSGINNYACICYSSKKVFFTTNKKSICKYNSEGNKYKNTYICKELNTINSETLKTYNGLKFCGKYSSKNISSYHNSIVNRFDSSNNIDYYLQKSIILPANEYGILDIKIIESGNEEKLKSKGYNCTDNLCIKKNNENSINILEFNEFIIDIHYSNELICTYEEMNNINPINDYYKNSRNVYKNNIKQCLNNENEDYKNYYIDDNFVRTSIIDERVENILEMNTRYNQTPNIKKYYEDINNEVDVMKYMTNYPILVAQRYLYGIGCQYYEQISKYYSFFRYFYHNKNMAFSIIIFTLISSVTSIIFVSFNLYQNCVDYPTVYLTFCIILVASLVIDMILTGIYLGYCLYVRYFFSKIFNECRIDFSGLIRESNYQHLYNYNQQTLNKALPMEIGLYEDLNFAMYVSLVMAVTEVIIFILLVIYFAFNCYRYTFISLKNEGGDFVKSRKRKKKDLMELVKMI
jgi:hypothetical protein